MKSSRVPRFCVSSSTARLWASSCCSSHLSFAHLEVLLKSLFAPAGALMVVCRSRNTQDSAPCEATSAFPIELPVLQSDVVTAQLLAFPLDFAICQSAIRQFLRSCDCRAVLQYCTDNNVAIRLSKAENEAVAKCDQRVESTQDVDILLALMTVLVTPDDALQRLEAGELPVASLSSKGTGTPHESSSRRHSSVAVPDASAYGRIGVLLAEDLLGDSVAMSQLRHELYRALCNFLLRHLFSRLESACPADSSSGGSCNRSPVPGLSYLQRLSKATHSIIVPLTSLASIPRNVEISAGDPLCVPMEEHYAHLLHSMREGVLHDVINGYGYNTRKLPMGVRPCVVAVLMADLMELQFDSDSGTSVRHNNDTRQEDADAARLAAVNGTAIHDEQSAASTAQLAARVILRTVAFLEVERQMEEEKQRVILMPPCYAPRETDWVVRRCSARQRSDRWAVMALEFLCVLLEGDELKLDMNGRRCEGKDDGSVLLCAVVDALPRWVELLRIREKALLSRCVSSYARHAVCGYRRAVERGSARFYAAWEAHRPVAVRCKKNESPPPSSLG